FDRTDADLVVIAHHRDLITSLQLDHRLLRDEQRALLRSRRCSNAPVAAWSKKIVGIGENARNSYGPGCGIHLAVGKRNASSLFINSAVGKNQLQRYVLPLLLYAGLRRIAAMEISECLLADGEVSLDRINLRN